MDNQNLKLAGTSVGINKPACQIGVSSFKTSWVLDVQRTGQTE